MVMNVYRELLVDENTRKVELRYIDETTGQVMTSVARGLQSLPATPPDLGLFICGGFRAEQGVLMPTDWALPPIPA